MARRVIAFGPLSVAFDDGVLAPRLWTLAQSEWVAELASDLPAGAILELCAGAGHIGQAATVLTGRDLVQIDVDGHACALAEANAVVNVDHSSVEVRCADVDEAVGPDERFPIVLCDPPYLPSAEVGDWPDDPRRAIDGGADGTKLLRRCLTVAGRAVTETGVVLLQARGAAQLDALEAAATEAGLALDEVRTIDPDRAIGLFSRCRRG